MKLRAMLRSTPRMARKKPRYIVRTQTVLDILRFLELTPAAARQIMHASVSFGGPDDPGEFDNVRDVRKKMESLVEGDLVTLRTYAVGGHPPMNFYQLSRAGYRFLHQADPPTGYRVRVDDVAPTQREHMYGLSRVIAHIVRCAARCGARITWAKAENTYEICVGGLRTKPDFPHVLMHSGRRINSFWEDDRGTEPIDSPAKSSVRNKIVVYEAYYDWLIDRWKTGQFGKLPRPRIRVPFTTTTMDRAEHILYIASQLARNPERLLVYACSSDSFLNEPRALTNPIFYDHHGNAQAIVNVHPTAQLHGNTIRLSPQFETSPVLI